MANDALLKETFCCLLQSNGRTFPHNAMSSNVEKRAKVGLVYICCGGDGGAWKRHWYNIAEGRPKLVLLSAGSKFGLLLARAHD